jgi:hypothetical protein
LTNNNFIMLSPDGKNWNAHSLTSSRANWSSLAWTGKQFVVAGMSDTVLTSPDGVLWTKNPLDTSNRQQQFIRNLVWTGAKTVAVGENDSGGVIFSSSDDGTTWSKMLSIKNASIAGAAARGNDLYALGTNQTGPIALSSTDGTHWAQTTIETNLRLYAIACNGAILVIVGESGAILSSTDGSIWTKRESHTTRTLVDIIWTGEYFAAVGDGGVVLTSVDGETWNFHGSVTGDGLWRIAWTGKQYVVVGENSTILTSPNGIIWTSHAVDAQYYWLYNILWTGTQLCACGFTNDSAIILTSPDGNAWTTRFTTIRGGCSYAMAWSGSRIVSVGDSGSVVTSSDGVTWTQRFAGSTHYRLYGIAWNGNQFIAAGQYRDTTFGDGVILSSLDGISWNAITNVTSRALFDVIWAKNQFVAVGVNAFVLASEDGKTWDTISHNSYNVDFMRIRWTGDQFLAIGRTSNFFSSTDGKEWKEVETGSSMPLSDVIRVGAQTVAIGEYGTILTSDSNQPLSVKKKELRPFNTGSPMTVRMKSPTMLAFSCEPPLHGVCTIDLRTVQGRKIVSFVENYRSPATIRIPLPKIGISSGVYCLSVRSQSVRCAKLFMVP